MGCLLSCLGIRDNCFTFLQPLPQSSTDDMTGSQDCSALLLHLHQGNLSYDELGRNALEPPQIQIITKELEDEAMFLKACGTIPATPPEIRKANKEINCSTPHARGNETSEFNSWLPASLTQTFSVINEHNLPVLPLKQPEDWRKELVSELTPMSCITAAQNTGGNSVSPIEDYLMRDKAPLSKIHPNQPDKMMTPVSSWLSNKTAQRGTKSVRFTCELDADSLSSHSSSSSKSAQNIKNFELHADRSISKPSPYPTPRKLTEEMQTPGTVFPRNPNDVTNGKLGRIRSQYVYSQKSFKNLSTWKALKEEGYESYHSTEKHIVNPFLETESEHTSKEDFEEEPSMPSWLKSRMTDSDDYDLTDEETSNINFDFNRNHGDRPILAGVATELKEDEPTPLLHKWWDGNGIPNTTSKFKEDQKVIWHGTPFEKRLEKALRWEFYTSKHEAKSQTERERNEAVTHSYSEESWCTIGSLILFVLKGSRVSEEPVVYNDDEENNTAKSHIYSLARVKPVISF